MSASIAEKIAARQRRVEERLDRFNYPDDMSRPMLRGTNLHYELADRDVGTACGGIGLIHQLVQRLESPAIRALLLASFLSAARHCTERCSECESVPICWQERQAQSPKYLWSTLISGPVYAICSSRICGQLPRGIWHSQLFARVRAVILQNTRRSKFWTP